MSGMYTKSGDPVFNPEAYARAGGQCYNTAGTRINNPTAYADAISTRKSQNSDQPKEFYHYTDTKSAQQIERSGRINQSQGPGDCVLGEGTYLTGKHPSCRDDTILTNNYGSSSGRSGKVDSFVKIPAKNIKVESGKDATGRNVFVHRGDIDLNKVGGKVVNRKPGGKVVNRNPYDKNRKPYDKN